MAFVHLHRHSEFSRLDGVGTASQYAERAALQGQKALAIADHGTLSGALHHIKACRDNSVVPIVGVEAYFRPNRLTAKERGERKAWHLCLFAKNLTGWHSLLRLVSTAYGEPEEGGGFYDKPCVDWELLERHKEGLICSSACISSWMSELIQGGDSAEVRDYVYRMTKIFGDDFWIEIMPHNFDDQRTLNVELVSIAHDFSVPLIATNDAHFPYPEWADTHRVAKIMGSGSSFEKARRDAEEGKASYLADLNPSLYLCSEQEMYDWFEEHHPNLSANVVHEAIQNTATLVGRVKPYMLDKSDKVPKITESVDESERLLREWIEDGLGEIAARGVQDFSEYEKRVETEWAVLKKKGVLDYFVLVGMICRWARRNGIRVGLGRGSAAGCLISYLIGITAIDPLPYGLLFERFLNPERKGLPDIDLDFDSERRSEVKDYIAHELFDPEYVADIITHARFQPKMVIQALCRVYDVPYVEAHAVTDTIEIRQDDEETTLEELLPLNEKLREFKDAHPEIWKHALRLEGMIANAGKHAAGIIITPKPIADYMALERGKKGDLVTSWSDAADFPAVSDHGFVKLDALGITGLTKHEYACKLIAQSGKTPPDLNALPALSNPYAVDPEVMEGFKKGHTIGVFQFGGRGITSLLREIQPDHINDLTAANALYRPGPMKGGIHREYAKRKHGVSQIDYWHELIRPVLEETYGLVAYQEQVMEIVKQIGGFSGAEADDMRKAMGKLYRIKGGTAAKKFMAKYESKWFAGAEAHGLDRRVADEIWHKLLEFGHYGFNKSHSASYALQAYQDMWLKVKHPAEFYAAFLTYEDDEDKRKIALREAAALGIEIVLPDVNESDVGYTVKDGKLVLGLTAIKGIGERSAAQIVERRPFSSFDDLLTRGGSDVPVRPLLESGALDNLVDRAYMLSTVQKLGTKSEAEWQVWEHLKHNTKLRKPREVPIERREPSEDSLGRMQAACLNLPVSSISMSDAHRQIIEDRIWPSDEIDEAERGTNGIVVAGEISKIIEKKTKKKKPYANVTIVYGSDEWTLKFWSEALAQFGHLLSEGRVIMAAGRKDVWKDYVSIVVSDCIAIETLAEEIEREKA